MGVTWATTTMLGATCVRECVCPGVRSCVGTRVSNCLWVTLCVTADTPE